MPVAMDHWVATNEVALAVQILAAAVAVARGLVQIGQHLMGAQVWLSLDTRYRKWQHDYCNV